MIDYFSSVAAQLGIPVELIFLIVIWEAVWTAIAMWKSARKSHMWWFVIFFLVNLLAVPEIIYLIVTRKKSSKRRR